MQKRDLYQNQFSKKKGAIEPERPKKHPHIPVPTFPPSTPPPSWSPNDTVSPTLKSARVSGVHWGAHVRV